MTNVRKVLAWILIFFTFVLMITPLYAKAECGTLGAAPNEFLIRFQENNSIRNQKPISNLIENLGKNSKLIFESEKQFSKGKVSQLKKMPPNLIVTELDPRDLKTLKSDSRVKSIQKNCLVDLNSLPNDPSLSSQWGIDLIKLQNAWGIETGKSNVVVSVVDSGIDYNHEDLNANMWINPVELGGTPNFDDDGNGCIDDIYGCDFADRDGDPKPGFTVNASHGTHVAGIVAAKGNNSIGISGTAWNVKIMAVKGFSDFSKYAKLSDLLAGVYYSVTNGADIINASWGSAFPPDQAEIDAFQFALDNGVLPIVAAGNDGIDSFQTTPAGIPGVFTVGSVGRSLQLSSFSNYGEAVNMLAPGGDSAMSGGVDEYIFSTLPMNDGKYGPSRGTSMAAPFVAGVAALIKSLNPSLNPRDIMEILVRSGSPLAVRNNDTQSTNASYPLLDAGEALRMAQTWIPTNDNSCFGSTCGQSIPGPVSPQIPTIKAPNSSNSGCSMQAQSQGSLPNTLDSNVFNLICLLFLISPLIILIFRKKS